MISLADRVSADGKRKALPGILITVESCCALEERNNRIDRKTNAVGRADGMLCPEYCIVP